MEEWMGRCEPGSVACDPEALRTARAGMGRGQADPPGRHWSGPEKGQLLTPQEPWEGRPGEPEQGDLLKLQQRSQMLDTGQGKGCTANGRVRIQMAQRACS